MEKKFKWTYLADVSRPKIFLRLKLLTFLFLLSMVTTAANSYSQQTKFNLKLENVTIRQVFKEIEANSEFIILYNEKNLDATRKVDVDVTNTTVEAVLDQVFAGTGNTYKIYDRQIVIKEAKAKEPSVVKTESSAAQQQKNSISGRVVDKDGFPIIGATVIVKNVPGKGVITDAEGKYTINVKPTDILGFTFIGYKGVEKVASEADKTAVVLQEDLQQMDEVVVVAFGKQKKESVVSSITTITPADLKIPSSNLTTAFAGRLAGVISYQRSGEPGMDNAEYFIRGITSFGVGKKDPLILIDGVEMTSNDLARMNPDDIASFSVMKDASAAALYGARGANGVMLVTTKEGKDEKLSISVRAENSISSNAQLVELADPVTYMKLHNEAVRTRNSLVPLPYSTQKIVNTEKGADPLLYPSVDWYNYLLKNHTNNQRVNLNLTGGGKAVRYYLAANGQHDTGILKENKENSFNNNININRVQVRSNVSIQFSPKTSGIIRFYGTFDESTGPKQGGAEVFSAARNATPVWFLPYYPKDSVNQFATHVLFGAHESATKYNNPYADVMSGYKKSSASMMLVQMEVEHKFDHKLEGLSIKGTFNLKRNSYYDLQRSYNPFYYAPIENMSNNEYRLFNFNPDGGTEYLNFDFGNSSISSAVYGEGRISYNKTIAKKHSINAMTVGTLRNATSTEVQNLQQSLPMRNISLAGRLAYGYDSRYFLEGNFGYNGSERFASNHRFGFFPSIGAGWLVTNEQFMKQYENSITKLKFKGTYGLVGSDQIGSLSDRFFYLSQITIPDGGRGYYFGTDRTYYRPGVTITRYANPDITWEISKKLDLGVELTLFKDLDINADYFSEERSHILWPRQDIPSTMGLVTTPQSSLGMATSHGFEAELKYSKSFNRYNWLVVNGNFTYTTSRVKDWEEPDYSDAPWRSRIGQKNNQSYGLIAERLFVDQQEVNNSPKQNYGEYMAGDIKYKDINNDGQIDDNDMVPIGFPTVPEIIYGFGFSMGVHSFDFSAFFQGSARSSFFLNPSATTPFISNGQRALLKYYADNHWSENNRDLYALWPRLSDYAVANNNVTSTWWLRNGSFLRLKNVEVGYTLPQEVSKKAGIQKIRFYFSGSNLFVASVFKMWDPEMAGNGLGYPVQRVYNVGLNLNF